MTWYPLSVPTIGEEEIDAATEVLRSQNTTMGSKVEEFEEAFARYVGSTHAVMVNSGSSADLLMAFATVRPPVHAQVIIPAVTWPTHAWSWHVAGYDIKFCDVDGINTTVEKIRNVAWAGDLVSVPHLMGIPVPLHDLIEHRVTEDCCEALGADVGHYGQMATWSFFFSHHMTTMEGGMITTHSDRTASYLRSLRSHGWVRHEGFEPYEFHTMGFNVRPTEVSAAIGLVQLRRLPKFNKLRDENWCIFTERLKDCPEIELIDAPAGSSPFGLPFFAEDRDGLEFFLNENGVETRPILGGNLLRQPAFSRWVGRQAFPGADRVHDHGIYVGLHPMADSGVDQVADLIGEYVG